MMKKARKGQEIPDNIAVDRGRTKGDPLFNLTELQKMAGNNNEFLHHAVSIFVQSSEEAAANFKKYLEQEEWLKIKEIAHKILPSFRHLEVNTVIPKLVELNNTISFTDEKAVIPALVKKIINEIKIVVKELKKELKK
ncbi:MAG: hypothetical protein ACFCUM_08070 [Bacteroidales bacterium]